MGNRNPAETAEKKRDRIGKKTVISEMWHWCLDVNKDFCLKKISQKSRISLETKNLKSKIFL